MVLGFFRGMSRGKKIAEHLYAFRIEYEGERASGNPQSYALQVALNVFDTCPVFCGLTTKHKVDLAVFLGNMKDPAAVIEKIILDFDSQKAFRALTDRDLLSRIAHADAEQYGNHSS